MNCKQCGVRQERWRNRQGIEHTNIDPTSGLCVSCLSQSALQQVKPMDAEPFDARKAAAGRDE